MLDEPKPDRPSAETAEMLIRIKGVLPSVTRYYFVDSPMMQKSLGSDPSAVSRLFNGLLNVASKAFDRFAARVIARLYDSSFATVRITKNASFVIKVTFSRQFDPGNGRPTVDAATVVSERMGRMVRD